MQPYFNIYAGSLVKEDTHHNAYIYLSDKH